LDLADMTQLSVVDRLTDQAIAGQQAGAVSDDDANAVRLLKFCNPPSVGHRVCNRLFYKDVLARLGCKFCEFKMPLIRNGEHYGIDVSVGENGRNVAGRYFELFCEGCKPLRIASNAANERYCR